MLFCTYNIHYGVGADGKYDVSRIADEIAAADIVALQELAAGWSLNGFADQTAEIAGRLNRYCWFHGAMDADSSEVGSDGVVRNRRRTFGNAVLSRWPISWARGHLLPKNRMMNVFDLQRGFVEAAIAAPGGALRVHSVHLSHLGPQQRLPQLASLMQTVLNAERIGATWDATGGQSFMFQEPTLEVPREAIVAGDFNFNPVHPEYPLVCGEPSQRGRLTTSVHLADAWSLAGKGDDIHTSPGDGRIDHVFVTHGLASRVKRAWVDHDARGSDHWPVFVEFDL